MRVLTVNIIGIPSGSDSNLADANVFQDYDAVVVDPESLDRLYSRIDYYNRDAEILTQECGGILSAVNKKRREQVGGLLLRGGVVVCFMQPLNECSYNWRYEGEDRWSSVTNYHWLMTSRDIDRELGEINYSKGETIDYIDSGHPFSNYLNTKPSWSAYIDIDACESWKVIASAFNTHAVALSKRLGLGHIILLPSYYDHHNGELLESCIIKLLGDKETTPQPSWAKPILVHGQEELNLKITEFSDKIDTLTEQRKGVIDKRDELERWKYLIYAKGKHQLEPVVREALALIGCNIEPQPDKDSDGIVSCDYGTALLEVVGSKETIRLRKLGELTTNMGNFMSEKETSVNGILVGNPFCEEPLDNRPPDKSQKKLFAKELIDSAEKQGIPVLLSTELYQIVCSILKDELPEEEKQSLQEQIFNGKGLVRLI